MGTTGGTYSARIFRPVMLYKVNMAKNKAEYRRCSGEDDFTFKHWE